jgi:membrane-associated protease RseP (regulator of RpoE activity)
LYALAVVGFFVALLLIIMIHEGGHYLAARGFGFRVLEYFVGFGPKVWSTRRGEIEYGVKAIPAGGYVKIAGMNPYETVPPEDVPRAYFSKPIWQRAIVILAGPLSHFVVAAMIFTGLLLTVGDLTTKAVVGGIDEATVDGIALPAAELGVSPGDRFIEVGDLSDPTPDELREYVTARVGQPVEFTFERDDSSTYTVTMVPVAEDRAGETIGRVGVQLRPVPRPLPAAVAGGVAEVYNLSKTSILQIGHVFGPNGVGRLFKLLFTDEPRTLEDPTSVVGVAQQVGAIGNQGEWATAVYVFGFVTLFIGLINLVPLPPFDGGHLAVLAIEKIRGRAIDMRKLIPVSVVVMGFLIVFVLATVVLDVTKRVPFAP